MSAISTVKLPVVKPDTTIAQAVQSLRKEGTSGVVVMDLRGPVVVTDESLLNSLIAAGGDDATLMSVIAARAFVPAPPRGLRNFFSSNSRPVFANAQNDYVVSNFNTTAATVITDPKRAAKLNQPSSLDFSVGTDVT